MHSREKVTERDLKENRRIEKVQHLYIYQVTHLRASVKVKRKKPHKKISNKKVLNLDNIGM